MTDAKQGAKVEAPIIMALGLITGSGLLHKSHPVFGQLPDGFAHSFSFTE